ncbi:hypothetical protein ACFL3D_06395 [Candidatus Omnitrophota bacterium]
MITSAIHPVFAAAGPHGEAPNSGDGIPDGSGFEGHFGPNS